MLKERPDKVDDVRGAWSMEVSANFHFVLCSAQDDHIPSPPVQPPFQMPNGLFLSAPFVRSLCDYKSILYSLGGGKSEKKERIEKKI